MNDRCVPEYVLCDAQPSGSRRLRLLPDVPKAETTLGSAPSVDVTELSLARDPMQLLQVRIVEVRLLPVPSIRETPPTDLVQRAAAEERVIDVRILEAGAPQLCSFQMSRLQVRLLELCVLQMRAFESC